MNIPRFVGPLNLVRRKGAVANSAFQIGFVQYWVASFTVESGEICFDLR